jgi:hypothetical protein
MADYYTVKAGDSYERIAQIVYGNERMFGNLMAANGGATLRPGMSIRLPGAVANPFVSNELASEMGMATSGQVSAAYKAGDLGSNGVQWKNGQFVAAGQNAGRMNWTPEQAQFNRNAAYNNSWGGGAKLVNSMWDITGVTNPQSAGLAKTTPKTPGVTGGAGNFISPAMLDRGTRTSRPVGETTQAQFLANAQ